MIGWAVEITDHAGDHLAGRAGELSVEADVVADPAGEPIPLREPEQDVVPVPRRGCRPGDRRRSCRSPSHPTPRPCRRHRRSHHHRHRRRCSHPPTAVERVVAAPTDEHVRIARADEEVEPGPPMITSFQKAVEEIGALPAADHVVAEAAHHRVVPAEGGDHVRPRRSDDDVTAARADDRRPQPIAGRSDRVLPATRLAATDLLAPEAGVVAGSPDDHVVVRVGAKLVVSIAAVDDVVAAPPSSRSLPWPPAIASFPGPPTSTSSPGPAFTSASFPGPPYRWSLPASSPPEVVDHRDRRTASRSLLRRTARRRQPPMRMSFPSDPTSSSSPALPQITSSPPSPLITSSPAPPTITVRVPASPRSSRPPTFRRWSPGGRGTSGGWSAPVRRARAKERPTGPRPATRPPRERGARRGAICRARGGGCRRPGVGGYARPHPSSSGRSPRPGAVRQPR